MYVHMFFESLQKEPYVQVYVLYTSSKDPFSKCMRICFWYLREGALYLNVCILILYISAKNLYVSTAVIYISNICIYISTICIYI